MVTQIREEVAMNIPVGDCLVPTVLVSSGDSLPGQMPFGERKFYPQRIRENGSSAFLERSVREVLALRCEPLVLIDGDNKIVAVYYSPGPKAVPMSSVELVAT